MVDLGNFANPCTSRRLANDVALCAGSNGINVATGTPRSLMTIFCSTLTFRTQSPVLRCKSRTEISFMCTLCTGRACLVKPVSFRNAIVPKMVLELVLVPDYLAAGQIKVSRVLSGPERRPAPAPIFKAFSRLNKAAIRSRRWTARDPFGRKRIPPAFSAAKPSSPPR